MSNWLEDYEGVWDRFEKFKNDYPDLRSLSLRPNFIEPGMMLNLLLLDYLAR
jgi:hypothetical protein